MRRMRRTKRRRRRLCSVSRSSWRWWWSTLEPSIHTVRFVGLGKRMLFILFYLICGRGVIRNFPEGGLIFCMGVGAQHPLGPKHPLKTKDFTDLGGTEPPKPPPEYASYIRPKLL